MDTNLKWINLEDSAIPPFTIGCITNYFVSRIADDGLPRNDYKPLNSHAYPLFKAGHIQSISVAMQADTYKIRCKCLPEMKKDILYNVNVTIDKSGEILTAACGCPAGVGPMASCKHICALCYALEEFYRIKQLRSPHSHTSQLQKWNHPRKRKLDSCSVNDITFVKHDGKKKKEQDPLVYDPRPPSLRSTSESSLSNLRRELENTGRDIVLLHLIPEGSTDDVNSSELHVPSLPLSPSDVRQHHLDDLQAKPQPVHLEDISTAGLAFVQVLQYTEEQIKSVEIATRDQSVSKRWYEERQYRITASKFGRVVKRKRQHTSLVHQLLYTSVNPSVSALQWGQQHEQDALHEYCQSLNGGLMLIKAGLFLDKCGYLGASPDGIVLDSSGQPVKVVEVKCPFSARDKTVEQACTEKSFCCSILDGKPRLKFNSEYYYQVQGQMAITCIHVCDFIIWTPKSLNVQTIHFDSEFWTRTCLPKLHHFYYSFLLPEIIYPQHPNMPHDYSSYMHMYK